MPRDIASALGPGCASMTRERWMLWMLVGLSAIMGIFSSCSVEGTQNVPSVVPVAAGAFGFLTSFQLFDGPSGRRPVSTITKATRSHGKLLRTPFAANRFWQNPFAALLLSCYVSQLSGGNRPNHQLGQVVRAIRPRQAGWGRGCCASPLDWLGSSPIKQVLNVSG